jgi:hypothetical protein
MFLTGVFDTGKIWTPLSLTPSKNLVTELVRKRTHKPSASKTPCDQFVVSDGKEPKPLMCILEHLTKIPSDETALIRDKGDTAWIL